MNNFASMSAITDAFSSVNTTHLPLTWSYVRHKSKFDVILKCNEPTGGFSECHSLMTKTDGPYVPFVMPYLINIQHIKDRFVDDGENISFTQRQRCYDVVSFMLKFQGKPYNIAESESTSKFILGHLEAMVGQDFSKRMLDMQECELAHADIKTGLRSSGFW